MPLGQRRPFVAPLFLLVAIGFCPALFAQNPASQRIIIETTGTKDDIVAKVEDWGGTVTQIYENLDLIAADVPGDSLDTIRALPGVGAVHKDIEVPSPKRVGPFNTRGGPMPLGDLDEIAAARLTTVAIQDIPAYAADVPAAYRYNNSRTRVRELHAMGYTGEDVVVAVIDSGIRPQFDDIANDVIGCDDIVAETKGGRDRCVDRGNTGHGTFVASVITANQVATFSPRSDFLASVARHTWNGTDSAVIDGSQLAVIGTAPGAKIYALRVFDSSRLRADSSQILLAVERVIELKESGINIRVANMSLGRRTLYAGRGLFERAIDKLLDAGIVPVVSSGNSGPALLTTASPGSSFTAITVGAGSIAHQERVVAETIFGSGVDGHDVRPYSGPQTAWFSSRGPNADGHGDPDVMAAGFGMLGQGLSNRANRVSIATGTSFSAPAVSGIAAVLWGAFGDQFTATQIRNAIVATANPNVIDNGATAADQGNGYVDALAAYNLLQSGQASDLLSIPPNATQNVKANMVNGAHLSVEDGPYQAAIESLEPGERRDILYEVKPGTTALTVILSNVEAESDSGNVFFGRDDIQLGIHSSKTSAIADGDYYDLNPDPGSRFAFIGEDFEPPGISAEDCDPGAQSCVFVIPNPEPGIVRVTVNGTWTNLDSISAQVTIYATTGPEPGHTAQGQISESEFISFPVEIPAGVSIVDFKLTWAEDWSRYPTSDIDMFLVGPNPEDFLDGTSLDVPEILSVSSPTPGTWTVFLLGFEVSVASDRYELRVLADGQLLN